MKRTIKRRSPPLRLTFATIRWVPAPRDCLDPAIAVLLKPIAKETARA